MAALLRSALLLSLLFSVSRAFPLSCEDRLRPLDLRRAGGQLWGRWALVAGSLSHPPSLEALGARDSISVVFTPASPNDGGDGNATAASYLQINRFGPSCRPLRYNVSLGSDGAFAFVTGGRFNLTGVFLAVASCPDCVAMLWNVESSRRVSLELYLLGRRREAGAEAMEEYGAQLRCLGLPAPVVMDPNKSLCDDEGHGPGENESR